ncbi:Cyanobacterial aminoacyl-tRNA synthetase [Macleaya cordata]|uniref:Cyanobacterial aminoacyl-tRNA synthetase n=1 Tax=Macleaya cordata TaxID=56857 RepID=A0A200PUD6_MACCD|nr:Cyanobacterial aminoacyl-tRNA synthetase [Macleaya cordata]
MKKVGKSDTTILDRLHYFATPLRAETTKQNVVSINEQFEEVSDGVVTMDEDHAAEQNVFYEAKPAEEIAKEDSPMKEQLLAFEFLDRLNIKLDLEDTYSILVYGSSALVGLWLASAIIGALDSIPVFPKVLELVGLAFTIRFSSRYLIFKKNRDELTAKVEELKQQIIGSNND